MTWNEADPLAPVRSALLAAAARDAASVVAAARADAAAIIERAHESAARTVAAGRSAGAARGAALAAAELSGGRARAREIVLAARREALDQLRDLIRAKASRLRDDPGYPELLGRLSALAMAVAGPGATLDPCPDGGVRARSGQAIADCSLTRLAGLAAEALGERVRELWTP